MSDKVSGTDVVAVDIGGTYARFAIARVTRARVYLSEVTTLSTDDYPSLIHAWHAFAAGQRRPLPHAAAIALACPMDHILKLTNNEWELDRDDIARDLGVDRHLVLNDFEAVAHAVAALPSTAMTHVAGFAFPLPTEGVISVIGPGTGLGVAQIIRRGDDLRVVATEGGHIGFAPGCALDDELLARLRERYGRVSVERAVSGSGLRAILDAMTGATSAEDDATLWRRAISGEHPDASSALEHFCYLLGVVAGDIALAHGADAVAIAGGLGLRLSSVLPNAASQPSSAFETGFVSKGRFMNRMFRLPVKVITHPQPGLFGAAAAFARKFAT